VQREHDTSRLDRYRQPVLTQQREPVRGMAGREFDRAEEYLRMKRSPQRRLELDSPEETRYVAVADEGGLDHPVHAEEPPGTVAREVLRDELA